MNVVTPTQKSPDYEKWNSKLNDSWSSADYSQVGTRLQITGENLAETADFKPGSLILDVAAGNGNATLAFARRWCNVVSTDFVSDFLESGKKRADAEGLDVQFQVADAQNLPFPEGSFDGVVSTFGVMFAPDQTENRFRNRPGLQNGRENRAYELDAQKLYRQVVPNDWQTHVGFAGISSTCKLGRSGMD